MAAVQQGDAKPVEGNRSEAPSQARTPTRTGDNEPTSDVTQREVKTMIAAPLLYIVVGILVFVVVMVAIAFAVFGGTGTG